jgi:hypothetical protein
MALAMIYGGALCAEIAWWAAAICTGVNSLGRQVEMLPFMSMMMY